MSAQTGTPMPDWFKCHWREVVEHNTGRTASLPPDVPAREPGDDDPELPDAPPADDDTELPVEDAEPSALDYLDPDDIPF